MASRKVTLDNLGEAIDKILEEYSQEVIDDVDQVTKQIAKTGAAAVRNEAKKQFQDSKKYAKSWTYAVETTRIGTIATIYNKKMAHLAHLLEFGHVSSNGSGRNYHTDKAPVAGREHVKPIEEKLVKEYEKGVKAKI